MRKVAHLTVCVCLYCKMYFMEKHTYFLFYYHPDTNWFLCCGTKSVKSVRVNWFLHQEDDNVKHRRIFNKGS